jgi:hypothetical protein
MVLFFLFYLAFSVRCVVYLLFCVSVVEELWCGMSFFVMCVSKKRYREIPYTLLCYLETFIKFS